MSQALRKLTAAIAKSRTCVIFINQIRMQIGVMFGNPETTTGGKALKFYSSVRIDIRRIGSIKEGEEVIGSRVRVKVVKNKVAAPFKQAEFDILYNTGISREGELIDLATEKDIVKKSGTWFSYGEERLGQGRENARVFLHDHPEVAAAIEAELRRRHDQAQAEADAKAMPPAAAALPGPVPAPGSGNGHSLVARGDKAPEPVGAGAARSREGRGIDADRQGTRAPAPAPAPGRPAAPVKRGRS
jgi:recombination protein RecA